jgi:hypothetical protein
VPPVDPPAVVLCTPIMVSPARVIVPIRRTLVAVETVVSCELTVPVLPSCN